MCADMCAGLCADICAGLCAGLCADMCAGSVMEAVLSSEHGGLHGDLADSGTVLTQALHIMISYLPVALQCACCQCMVLQLPKSLQQPSSPVAAR